MYSHEIDNFLRSRNWTISRNEYLYVTDINKSPQIARITYTPYENAFVMYTKDDYIWKFYVKGENEK